MEDFQLRVVEEKTVLDEKLAKLDAFLASALGLDPQDSYLLTRQRTYMKNYSDILEARIARMPAPEVNVEPVFTPVIEPRQDVEQRFGLPEGSLADPFLTLSDVESEPLVPVVSPPATPEELGVTIDADGTVTPLPGNEIVVENGEATVVGGILPPGKVAEAYPTPTE